MKLALRAALAAAALAGCAARSFPQADYRVSGDRLTPVTAPGVGESASAAVGDTMLRTFRVQNIPALEVSIAHREVTDYREGKQMAVALRPGTYLEVANDGAGGKFFEAPYGVQLSYQGFSGFGSPESVRGGVFVSRDGAKSAYWFWEGYGTATLVPTPGIQTASKSVEKPPSSLFERELVYTGSSQSTLTLLYREFIDSRARPAFAQELKYDLQRERVIGYQGARIEILSAGNTGITYRVLSSWTN